MFTCKRFQRLVGEARDRTLSPREDAFVQQHRNACAPCRASEYDSGIALNMLRMSALEPEVDIHFDARVLRRLKVQTSRESIRYWSPALLGAAIAGISVLAAMQLISKSVEMPQAGPQIGEAKLMMPRNNFPRFELDPPKRNP